MVKIKIRYPGSTQELTGKEAKKLVDTETWGKVYFAEGKGKGKYMLQQSRQYPNLWELVYLGGGKRTIVEAKNISFEE